MIYCFDRARTVIGAQREFLKKHRRTIDRFRLLYRDLYLHSRSQLYVDGQPQALAHELQYTYDYLRDSGRIDVLPKFHYMRRYVELDLVDAEAPASLSGQLHLYMQDLTTMKEADLCGTASMPERVFVSTVHKAKGLEFDHVIVYDAVEGKYPSAYANTQSGAEEEARKFYVAISRAKRRLTVTYCHQAVTRWGRIYPKVLTPYMASIREYFKYY